MENGTVESALELINKFVKSKVVMKKLNRYITNHVNSKYASLRFEDVFDPESYDGIIPKEIKEYFILRDNISQLHDQLFVSLSQLSSDGKEKVTSVIDEMLIRYGAVHEKSEKASARSIETEFYIETLTALKYYLRGLSCSKKNKK